MDFQLLCTPLKLNVLLNKHSPVHCFLDYQNKARWNNQPRKISRLKKKSITLEQIVCICSGPYEYFDHTRIVMTIRVYTHMVRVIDMMNVEKESHKLRVSIK